MTKEQAVNSKDPVRRPLKQVFSNLPVIQTCIPCGTSSTKSRHETLSEEIRYFPPRGIDVLALERSTLEGVMRPEVALLTQAQAILVNSPHPAVGLLHKYFSNDKGENDCEGQENANLDAVVTLIQYVWDKNVWWGDARWIGPKIMDVTIYIGFKYEASKFDGPKKRPYVLDEDSKYRNRVRDVAELVQKFPPPDPLPTNWPEITDAAAEQPKIVLFHIVPVLEDSPTFTESKYENLVKICKKELQGLKNVFFRRNPEDNRTISPLRYLETHPRNPELNTALDSIKKNQRTVAVMQKIVDKLTEQTKAGKQVAETLKKAKNDLKVKTRKLKDSLKSVGGNYGYVTGDCTPEENWWSKTTERRMISAAEDLANANRVVVGVLLFSGYWQGRSTAANLCVDQRKYSTPNVRQWTEAMSLGTDKKGSDGRLVRLAATPGPH